MKKLLQQLCACLLLCTAQLPHVKVTVGFMHWCHMRVSRCKPVHMRLLVDV